MHCITPSVIYYTYIYYAIWYGSSYFAHKQFPPLDGSCTLCPLFLNHFTLLLQISQIYSEGITENLFSVECSIFSQQNVQPQKLIVKGIFIFRKNVFITYNEISVPKKSNSFVLRLLLSLNTKTCIIIMFITGAVLPTHKTFSIKYPFFYPGMDSHHTNVI